jgi:hypothetical protein
MTIEGMIHHRHDRLPKLWVVQVAVAMCLALDTPFR